MSSAILRRSCSSAASPIRSGGAPRACRPLPSALPARAYLPRRESTAWLFAARGLSGFSTGLASGAATAWIAELYAGRASGGAARIASAANFFGCATGPLLGGLFAQFAFAPLRLCYFAYLVLLCGAAGAIFVPRETVTKRKPLRRRIASSPHWRAAAHPAAIRVPGRDRLCHLLADRLLLGVDPEPARRKPASIRSARRRRRRVRTVSGCRGCHPDQR